jgi:hypothetical protein
VNDVVILTDAAMRQTYLILNEDICVAFPIACVLAFIFVTTLYAAWQVITFASYWLRLCKACGGAKEAYGVLAGAEAIAKEVRR